MKWIDRLAQKLFPRPLEYLTSLYPLVPSEVVYIITHNGWVAVGVYFSHFLFGYLLAAFVLR